MSRLRRITPEMASHDIKKIYDGINEKMGEIPNIFQGMAISPVLLKAYLQLEELISQGTLSPLEQEIVRLAVSQQNGCEYCVAAHSSLCKVQGLDEQATLNIRRGTSDDPKQAALVTFSLRLLESKGFVSEDELQPFLDAGYTEAQVGEVLTIIGQKTLSNYFNHVNETENDMPAVPELSEVRP